MKKIKNIKKIKKIYIIITIIFIFISFLLWFYTYLKKNNIQKSIQKNIEQNDWIVKITDENNKNDRINNLKISNKERFKQIITWLQNNLKRKWIDLQFEKKFIIKYNKKNFIFYKYKLKSDRFKILNWKYIVFYYDNNIKSYDDILVWKFLKKIWIKNNVIINYFNFEYWLILFFSSKQDILSNIKSIQDKEKQKILLKIFYSFFK